MVGEQSGLIMFSSKNKLIGEQSGLLKFSSKNKLIAEQPGLRYFEATTMKTTSTTKGLQEEDARLQYGIWLIISF